MLLIAFIVWVVYAIIEGFREGYYWHYKNISNDDNEYEIHPIFATQRGLVLTIMGLLALLTFKKLCGLVIAMAILKSGLFIFSLMLMFSFIHNGMYYTTRNILDKKIYNLKWRAHSSTSTAKWTKFLNFRNRTIMFAFGLIGVLLLVIL